MQWLMPQQKRPADFVIATGVQHSIRQFVTLAAESLDIQMAWQGNGIDEKGIIDQIDPEQFSKLSREIRQSQAKASW